MYCYNCGSTIFPVMTYCNDIIMDLLIDRAQALSLMAEAHGRLGQTTSALRYAKECHAIAPLAFHSLITLAWVTAMSQSRDAMAEPMRLAVLAAHAEPTCPLPGLFQVSCD